MQTLQTLQINGSTVEKACAASGLVAKIGAGALAKLKVDL